MKTIEVDDDLYELIAKNTKEIGESASNILRRLLSFGPPEIKQVGTPESANELADLLQSPKLKYKEPFVNKFLYVLGEMFKRHPGEFEKVLTIQGKGRCYFARSEEAITRSGTSTQPKQIPGSGYWVMTNTPTRQKISMLLDVLSIFGYSDQVAAGVIKALDNRIQIC